MTDSIPAVVRCGDVVIDVRQGCIRRGDVEHRLRLKSFQVLVFLIHNRQRVVSKTELFDSIWGGVAVTEDTLVQSIVEIRKALGDDSRTPRFIRTMPKSGYRFVAAIEEDVDPETIIEYETVRRVEFELAQDDGKSASSSVRVAWIVAAAVVIAVAALELIRTRPGFAAFHDGGAVVAASRTSGRPIDAMTDNLEAYRWYATGVTLAQQFHDSEAIAAFERAIALDPRFAMAYARIGYAYGVTSTFPDRGRPYLDRALALHDRVSEKDRYYIEAWHAILHERYAAAIDIFQTLLTRYPTEIEARCHLGQLLASEERLDDAVAVLEHARLIDPESPQVFNILGALYRDQHRMDDAVAAHQKAVALAPDEPNLHDSLALSWQAAGKYGQALAEYDAALRLDPRFQIARIHRGNALYNMGRYRDAVHEFDEVARRAASDLERARAYESVAWVLRSRGDLAGAEAAAQRAATVDPAFNSVLLVLSADRGNLAKSHELRNAFNSTVHPGRGSRATLRFSYFYNGYDALKSGRTAEAVDLFRRAVQSQPPIYSVDTLDDCLADAFLSVGRYGEAAREYENVLKSNPERALSRFHLAETYEHLGRKEDARREYTRFLELWRTADADLPQVVAARGRLAS